jgi:phage host-nuclease inhibitor protein Gam
LPNVQQPLGPLLGVNQLTAGIRWRTRTVMRAVDGAGQVWEHFNLVELYRFIRARNDLLLTVEAARH